MAIGGLFARFIEEGRATLDDRGLVAMILSWPALHFRQDVPIIYNCSLHVFPCLSQVFRTTSRSLPIAKFK